MTQRIKLIREIAHINTPKIISGEPRIFAPFTGLESHNSSNTLLGLPIEMSDNLPIIGEVRLIGAEEVITAINEVIRSNEKEYK